MTVKELIDQLSEMPEDATVRVIHELVGNEQFIERIELKPDGCVWLHEMFD